MKKMDRILEQTIKRLGIPEEELQGLSREERLFYLLEQEAIANQARRPSAAHEMALPQMARLVRMLKDKISGNHMSIITEPHVRVLAREMKLALDRAQGLSTQEYQIVPTYLILRWVIVLLIVALAIIAFFVIRGF